MKANRTMLWKCVLVTLGAASSVFSAEITERELGPFQRPPGVQVERHVAKSADGVLAEIEGIASFEKWKPFEDDRVRFCYPDHEAISLDVKPRGTVVDGSRVSDVDTSFSRAYGLVADGQNLAVLMLADADWFDDGICLCGAIVYSRYLVRDGHLYRFSFLEDGVLKKMQVLGDGERLMMFEWTHSPIHPAVYRRIARSVELKRKGPWDEDDCRKLVMERYGPEGFVGWFDEGTSAKTVTSFLGGPSRTEGGGTRVWEYPKEEDGYRWTERLSLPFVDERLVRFNSSYYDSGWSEREAIRGGVPWMKQEAEPFDSPLVRGAKAKEMPEQLKKELLGLFLEKADDPDEDFGGLCQVLKVLVVQGVQDKKALDIVRRRFAEEGGHYAAWVLHEAAHVEDVALFVDKIRQIYRVAKEEPDENFDISADLHNWLAFIPDDDKRYPSLLRDGLGSPNASVRRSAYFFLDSAPFPLEERLAFVRSGLRDPDKRVRFWASGFYARNEMSNEDWKLLKDAAEHEKDEHTRKEMNEVLEGWEEQRTPRPAEANRAEQGATPDADKPRR